MTRWRGGWRARWRGRNRAGALRPTSGNARRRRLGDGGPVAELAGDVRTPAIDGARGRDRAGVLVASGYDTEAQTTRDQRRRRAMRRGSVADASVAIQAPA